MEDIYRITTSSACFGVFAVAGVVVDAAPIAKIRIKGELRSIIGMDIYNVILYYILVWDARIEIVEAPIENIHNTARS